MIPSRRFIHNTGIVPFDSFRNRERCDQSVFFRQQKMRICHDVIGYANVYAFKGSVDDKAIDRGCPTMAQVGFT